MVFNINAAVISESSSDRGNTRRAASGIRFSGLLIAPRGIGAHQHEVNLSGRTTLSAFEVSLKIPRPCRAIIGLSARRPDRALFLLRLATIQAIEREQYLWCLPPQDCFISAGAIECEVGQIRQTQKASREITPKPRLHNSIARVWDIVELLPTAQIALHRVLRH